MNSSKVNTHPAKALSVAGLFFLTATVSGQIIESEIRLEDTILTLPAGYTLQTVNIPHGIDLEVGGLDVRENGTLVISTRAGEVWEYKPAQDEWHRLTYGLYSPLGVRIDRASGDLFVAQMPELTRLVDSTGDGRIDTRLTISDQFGFSSNYHEYAFGPVIDSEGNFYITLNLTAHGTNRVKDAVMGRDAKYRGWTIKITPDGEFIPFASGLRSPAGIGINQANEIFVTDNEGDWVPTSYLAHIQEGRFYGHPNSLLDDPNFEGRDLNQISNEEYNALRTRPAVHFPHLAMAQSPGEPLFDETGGAFGPFEGQIFVGDQTFSKLMRVSLEKVGGEYQGTVFNFARALDSGVLRQVFSPDGKTLWVGQTDRGWASLGGVPFSLQKIVYDGHTIPFEMKTIQVRRDGFEIVFTKPVNRRQAEDANNYQINHWTYYYRPDYGSPYVDETALNLTRASVSADGLRVRLHADQTLPKERVYQIVLSNIEGSQKEDLVNHTGLYTLNNLPED